MSLKKSIRKLTAITAAMLIIHSNCYMFGLSLSKVIAQDIKEPNVNLSLENTQYVQFKEELENQETNSEGNEETEKQYNSGVAIKTKLQLALEEQETNLPIKSSEVVVSMPTLNECLPERVTVVNANTELTTGEKNNQKINQNYDSNSGLLTISYENESTYANYNKESKDEFEIIYIYPAQAYTGNKEEISLQYSVVAKVNFETENASTTAEKVQGIELTEKENKGTLLTFGVTRLEKNIYKGFMYSNVENKNNYDTDYNTVSTLCILNSNASNELTMKMEENKFVLNNKENTEILSEGKLLYKSTEISKTEFDKILGQEGSIEIYNEETLLATLKYIDVTENEETVKKLAIIYSEENIQILSPEETLAKIEFGEGVKSLIVKTTKPVSEGYMNFKNENTIKASENYNADVSKLKSIKTTSVINKQEENVELPLLEPETKISVNSSNVNFSTLQTSKTTLTINLDSTNETTKLFNNPTITIKLPDGIKNGILSSPEIVNGNGLTIKNANATNNVVTIELEGKQTSYDLTNVSDGASIVMDIENIDFDSTLPTHKDNIIVTCEQNKEQVKATKEVNIVSKAGLLVLSNITGLEDGKTITSIDNEPKVVEIQNNADQKEITQIINLVNNYDAKLTNTQIIGKIGYVNNELSSTFDIELSKPMEVENGKVYYSINKDATYNDESWTEEFTNQAKAYKIELEGSELESKATTQIKLYFKAQSNIGYNQETYVKTEINYTYNGQNLSDSTTFGMVTPKLEEALQTNLYTNNSNVAIGVVTTAGELEIKDGDEVNEGQILKSKITLINNNKVDMTYKIKTTINNAVYYELYETGKIYNLNGDPETRYGKAEQGDSNREYEVLVPAASSKEIEYQYAVNYDVENVTNNIHILNGNNEVVEEIKMENAVKKAKMELLVEYAYNEESLVYSTLNTMLHVNNLESKTLKNVEVEVNLSEELTPNSFEYYGNKNIEMNYDDTTNVLNINIDKISENEKIELIIIFDVKIDTKLTDSIVYINAKCNYDKTIYRSNDFCKKVYQDKTDLNMEVTHNAINNTVSVGDQIQYIVKITNNGALELNNAEIDFRPANGIAVNDAKIIYANGTEEKIEMDSNPGVKKELKIKKTDEIAIIYNATVEYTTEKMENLFELMDGYYNTIEKKVELVGIVEEKEDVPEQLPDETVPEIPIESTTPEIPTDPIDPEIPTEPTEPEEPTDPEIPEEPTQPTEPENPTNPEEPTRPETPEEKLYAISGIVWLDTNKNGKKDDGEVLQPNITVTLINNTTGNFALDSNGNKITATTDEQGKYTFNNLTSGTYSVMFEFDTNKYTVTTYQKEGVLQEINSDAILSTVTINGANKLVALTDKLELTSNKENIDLGLIENAKFDLSLDKQITKITVVNKQGTETFEYKDGHTAKVDLVAKYMAGSEVIVNYKFTITNEGEITGYVNSLMDSLPSGLEFNSEMNKDWYKDSDGNLYTTSLSGKAIKPGESIEIELILTKTMTEDNAGTFANNAKLEKMSNLENIVEKEEAKENNASSALLVISIKTGSVILYLGITTICLAIIGIGIYLIKKKVLNKGI